MSDIELLLGLLGVVVAVAWLARQVAVPYPVILVVAGLGIGLAPGLPDIEVDPEVILLVFVPPLVHAAAWTSSPRHLREHAAPIAWLSLGLVGLTTAAIAVVAHALVPDIGWGAAIALGAILSPNDAVAATSVFRRSGAPERVVSLIEGEALINDGTGLAIYRTAVGAVVAGTVAFGEAALEFVLVGTGGAALGLAIGWVAQRVRRRIDDSLIEITVTLLTPYLCFIGAEEAGLSGILAAVAAGVYLGNRSIHDFSAAVRIQATGFWTVLVFLLESVLFIIVGLQGPAIVERATEAVPTAELIGWALAVGGVLIGVRLVFTLVALPSFSVRERLVVGWSGLRGAISLAAALSIPTTLDSGAPFPQRDVIIFLVLAGIGLTLLLQGLTLPAVVRAAALRETHPSGGRAKALARFETVQAALREVSALSLDGDLPADTVERARSMYTDRARQLSGECRDGAPSSATSDLATWTALRRSLLDAERAALHSLRDDGRIPLEVFREVQHDLDLEEARLNRVAPAPAPDPVQAE